ASGSCGQFCVTGGLCLFEGTGRLLSGSEDPVAYHIYRLEGRACHQAEHQAKAGSLDPFWRLLSRFLLGSSLRVLPMELACAVLILILIVCIFIGIVIVILVIHHLYSPFTGSFSFSAC